MRELTRLKRPPIRCRVLLLATCRSTAIFLSPVRERAKGTGFEYSSDAGGEIETWTVIDGGSGGRSQRVPRNEAHQKDRATGWKAPHVDFQLRPGHQRIL